MRLTAESVARAERALSRGDRALRKLIREHGPCTLHRGRADYFDVLAWSIVNQQISTRAAEAIHGRVLDAIGERRLTAEGLLRAGPERLRAAGLSRNKTRFLTGLAEAARDGRLNFRSLARQSDERVMDSLVALPGVGAWTAQMFLMFAMRRADVFSPADIGLQRAAKNIYGLDERPAGEEFMRFAERWRPWRTIACWYLWRHVD